MMKAIILAAGRGSRMKENTDELPKCLTVLWEKTLLEWQLKALRKAGIKEIGVVTGYKSDKITEPGVKYFHNGDWDKTNMFASLLKAEEWLEDEECIISYSDIVYTNTAVEKLMESQSDIALTYYTDFLQLWEKRFSNPLEDIESFKIDEQSYLTEIGHKVNDLKEIEGQYMGLIKVSPRGWHTVKDKIKLNMPKSIEKIDMTTLFSFLIKNDVKIEAIAYNEIWLEVDSQEDLRLYSQWENKYMFV